MPSKDIQAACLINRSTYQTFVYAKEGFSDPVAPLQGLLGKAGRQNHEA